MLIKETTGVSFLGAVESPPLEDVDVRGDRARVGLGMQRGINASERGIRVAALSHPGTWRSRSSGPTARSRGFCVTPVRGPTPEARSRLAGGRG